jgi:hypothetical protein
MTFLVWPFVDADETWKTFQVSRETNDAGPATYQSWSYPLLPGSVDDFQLFAWPSDAIFQESQFRFSSNFNSRKARRNSPKIATCFPRVSRKRHSLLSNEIRKGLKDPSRLEKYEPIIKEASLRKILACKPPMWKTHEYSDSGKTREVRRFDPIALKYVTTKVPIMVRKIQLASGPMRFDLKTNALWFEEHQRSAANSSFFVYRNASDPSVQSLEDSVQYEAYTGPWVAIPNGVGSLGSVLHSIGDEFRASCLVNPPLIEYSSEIETLDNKVVSKLYGKILNQKVDLATALAEGAKSVRMIADLLMRLLDFFLGLYRLDPSRFLRGVRGLLKDLLPLSSKKLSNDFLAYRYGISPLMNDISGSVQAIAEYFDSSPKIYARSRSRTIIDNSSSSAEPISLGFRRYRSVDRVVIEIAYKVTYTIANHGQRRLTELGFTNPANVNWELVPFSFVVDWFLPIGNYLQGLNALDQLSVLECHRTTTIRKNRSYFYDHDGSGGAETGDLLPGANWSFGTSSVFVYREIIPVPTLPLPRFKNPFSIGHLLNGLALFVQQFK